MVNCKFWKHAVGTPFFLREFLGIFWEIFW